MKQFGLNQFKLYFKKLVRSLTLCLSLLLEGFSCSFPLPGISCGILCYWSIHKPEAISLWGLFGASLFFDSLMGQNVGITFFATFFIFASTLWYRRSLFQTSFWVVWLWFILHLYIC